MNKSPAFQFYAMDEQAKTASLTAVEKGAYFAWMCQCWIDGSLLKDFDRLARVAGIEGRGKAKQAEVIMHALCSLTLFIDDDQCFVSPSLDAARMKQMKSSEHQSNRVKSRWNKVRDASLSSSEIDTPVLPESIYPVLPIIEDGDEVEDKEAVKAFKASALKEDDLFLKQHEDSPAQGSPVKPVGTRKSPAVESPVFVEFYRDYPRHQGRADAWAAWQTKVKTPEQVLLLAQKTLAAKTGIWNGRETQYIPLPATWIRGGDWLDPLADMSAPKTFGSKPAVSSGASSLSNPEAFNAKHDTGELGKTKARLFKAWKALGKSISEAIELSDRLEEPPQ